VIDVIQQPTPAERDALVQSLAPVRLRSYRATFGGDTIAAIDLYLFEMEITAAIHQLLGLVEVAMREAMHRELEKVHGGSWFDRVTPLLDDRSRDQIRKAKKHLGRRPPAGKVIAEMDFGTWTCLLEPGGWADERTAQKYKTDYERDFWFPALINAFSGGSSIPARGHVSELSRHLRYARNRIAHRESVIFGIPQPGQRNAKGEWLRQSPDNLLRDIREVASLIDPTVGTWLSACDDADLLLADSRSVQAMTYAKSVPNKAWL
jgi:hypothetical protein